MRDKTPFAARNDPRPGPSRDLSTGDIARFRDTVLSHYRAHGRDLPWRRTSDPYRILVSEVMLQQTQVSRVAEKFGPFVEQFEDFSALAAAPLIEVLSFWKGLGYNRRALYLKETARIVVDRFAGRLPDLPEELAKLPGIGGNTAGAIAAFAFNRPVVFIETNIRSVFIHHFFPDTADVRDSRILPLVEATLDRENPRVWYWALMDYGTMLKETTANPGRRSAHYARQSPFSGSNREIRGAILKRLIDAGRPGVCGAMTETEIIAALTMDPERIRKVLAQLISEGFIIGERGRCRIA
jgi:A/G-specific adenine glycosylase